METSRWRYRAAADWSRAKTRASLSGSNDDSSTDDSASSSTSAADAAVWAALGLIGIAATGYYQYQVVGGGELRFDKMLPLPSPSNTTAQPLIQKVQASFWNDVAMLKWGSADVRKGQRS